jgi:predicted metal-dependent enzyme (double-stranded beta helix superfamily)
MSQLERHRVPFDTFYCVRFHCDRSTVFASEPFFTRACHECQHDAREHQHSLNQAPLQSGHGPADFSVSAFRGRDRLIAAVDAAMTSGDAERITADLQLALQEAITDSRIELPECVHRPVSDHYARRPLYHSREHGYSVIAMSWGPGQGTPLHDHDAMWCVEGVWLGELEITRYELLECAGERWRFRRHAALRGGCGSAGSLIPPHEYHTLRNASDQALAISVHVYEAPMERSAVFDPLGGDWYQRRIQALQADPA